MFKLFFLVIICHLIFIEISYAQFKYPFARKESFDTVIYGKKISDQYFWMSRKENEKEVTAFSRAQGQLAHSILDSITGTEIILTEWDQAMNAIKDEIWNGRAVGDYIYYNREIAGEGVWFCRRKGIAGAEEKIISNVQINGQRYSIRKRMVAHTKPLLALMLTQRGEANPQIRIYDMEKKRFLSDSIAPVMFNDARGVSMAWLLGDEALLYTQAPSTNKQGEIYFNGKIKKHRIGTNSAADELLFGIGEIPGVKLQPHETPYIYSFKHSPYLVARVRSGAGANYAFAVHYSKLNGKKTPWKRLKNYVNLSNGFDASGKFLYAATTGSPQYRLVRINMETGELPEALWKPSDGILAGSDYKHNSAIIAGKNVVYALIRKIGHMQIIKIDLKTKAVSLLPSYKNGSISELSLSGDDDLLFASFSAVRSPQYLLYSFAAKKLLPLPFADKVYDASGSLETKLIWIPSRDGQRIPVSLIYKKGLQLQNNKPLLIDGYGNGGMSNDLTYDPNYRPWLNRNCIYAYAHVRGGGELGEDWEKDGQFPHKLNSINDGVDVAAYFVKNHYTSPLKQFIMGTSAGSFLVGNAINQRPDLFAGGIFLQGLPDAVLYQNEAAGREQQETVPLKTKAGFESRYSISSYYHIPDNLKLPAMLIIHGATDYILSMHPVARYAAKLQENQKGNRPILFLPSWEGGHLGNQEELLYTLKFALWQSGHPDFQLKK